MFHRLMHYKFFKSHFLYKKYCIRKIFGEKMKHILQNKFVKKLKKTIM